VNLSRNGNRAYFTEREGMAAALSMSAEESARCLWQYQRVGELVRVSGEGEPPFLRISLKINGS
jgi:hypothetical protein